MFESSFIFSHIFILLVRFLDHFPYFIRKIRAKCIIMLVCPSVPLNKF
jgi:hypothetical protein